MFNPPSDISPPPNLKKKVIRHWLDEALRGPLYSSIFFPIQYSLKGFQVSENNTEFIPALTTGIFIGISIIFSMAIYYSNNKLLKLAQEMWLTTWSNFTFLLWAGNFVLAEFLKWFSLSQTITGVGGDLAYISLFCVGMFFSLNNDAVKKFIADFFPRLMESSPSKPRRLAQKIYNVLAKFFEGVGLGNAIVTAFSKLLGPAVTGVNWSFMILLGGFKIVKESAPNLVNRIINYPRALWRKWWYGDYQEIASAAVEVHEAPTVTDQEPQYSFLTPEDRLNSVLYLEALIEELLKFKKTPNILLISLPMIAKALLAPLTMNPATYTALYAQFKPSKKENIPEAESKQEEKSKEESTEVDTNLLFLFEPETLTTEERKRLKEEEDEETEKGVSEFTS